MKLSVLGSSSAGNGYVIQNESEAIVIECGCPLLDCEKKLDFNLKKVSGVLITHEHGDHAKYAKQYASMRLPLYATSGTLSGMDLPIGSSVHELQYRKVFTIGNFRVLPFATIHDAKQPCGYLIDCPDGNRVLFATDTHHLPYFFKQVDYYLVECNYDEGLLKENVQNGNVHPMVAQRTRLTHMSLRRCINALVENATNAKAIVLLHLSHENSRNDLFLNEVRKYTGKMTFIAQKNFEMEFINNDTASRNS